MFTKENYQKEYEGIYADLGIGGSGSPEFKRSEAYYGLPKRGGYKDGETLLDYGCGWGAMCGGFDYPGYFGCDIVPKAIELAKTHFPNKEFEVLKTGKLNIEPKDFCIALSVFTHVLPQDVDDCLGDIARNAKRGALIDILAAQKDSTLHVRYVDKRWFIKKLAEFGFKVIGEFDIMGAYEYNHTYLICEK